MSELAKFWLFIVFGGSPIWVTVLAHIIALVFTGSVGSGPWLFVIALPACGVTLFLATIAYLVYEKASAPEPVRKWLAIGIPVAFWLAIAAAIGLYWKAKVDRQQRFEEEKLEVQEFARHHPAFAEAAPGHRSASVINWTVSDNLRPPRYVVSARGSDNSYVYAMVDVERSGDQSRYSLACITTQKGKACPGEDTDRGR